MDVKKVQDYVRRFTRARDWDQFHSPKNVASCLTVEVAELNEFFIWISEKDSYAIASDESTREKISDEIGDVLQTVLHLADLLNIDPEAALWNKLRKTEQKYPSSECSGRSDKYHSYTAAYDGGGNSC